MLPTPRPSPSPYHASSSAVIKKCVNGAKVQQVSVKTSKKSGTDEAEHGSAHIPLITLLVSLKPRAVIVAAQCLKEGKQGYVKVELCNHE